MLIQYTAFDRNGNRVSGTLEADSEQRAEEVLWDSDLIVTRVHKVRKPLALYSLFPTIFGVKQRDTIVLLRQLATLLDSGLSLLLAIEALGSERSHPMLRDALRGITQHIAEGGQFSDALALYPAMFPSIFVRLAAIGEQSGELSQMLRRGAEHLEAQEAIKSKVRGAMMYPAMVALTAGVAVYILLTFSIPMLSGLLEEFGADLPLITKLVLAASGFATNFGPILFGMVIGVVAVVFLVRKRPAGKMATDRFFLKVPLLGELVQGSSVARITSTLHSLIAAGIPLLEGVELTRDSTENAVLSQALESARLGLLSGDNFSESLRRSPIFPLTVVEVVRIGETSGNLEEQLGAISNLIQQDFDTKVSRLIGFIEPAMVLGVGGLVALVAVTVITTVYSILPTIQ